jgi:hypothetical protein
MKKALWPLLVLFIGTLCLLPAEPAAANGSQLLFWDDEMTSTREVFGANAIVAIRFGRMANIFECQGDGIDDPPYPLTDIYVVKQVSSPGATKFSTSTVRLTQFRPTSSAESLTTRRLPKRRRAAT